MQIQIEIDDALMARIDKTSEIQKMTRADAVKEALEEWIDGQPTSSGWDDILSIPPDPDWICPSTYRPKTW